LPAPGIGGEPAALLRREFVLDGPVARARLYGTAHGVYEAELNGSVVGDAVLSPGWTSYHHRLRYQTYDVTDVLVEGSNAIGIHLADGWFRGYLGFAGMRNVYGDRTAALVQLELEHADGTRTIVATDGSWPSTLGPLTRADIYNGETFDARREFPGWSAPGFDDIEWTPVKVGDFDPARLVAPTGPPVRRTQTVAAASLTTFPSGRTLVDFGQNLVGWLRLRLPQAPAGTEITIRHAEVLENGELGTRPLREAAQTDVVLLDGNRTRSWEPRFTFHGLPIRGGKRLAGRADDVGSRGRCPAHRHVADRHVQLFGPRIEPPAQERRLEYAGQLRGCPDRTPLICDALTAAGEIDAAYALLLQRGWPSWLYPVTMGATTIWERWNSMLPDGSINPGQMTSFNHYALGAVADWMHRIVAGLAPAEPGYRRLRIAPRPGGRLTSAAATHETPYGTAEVAWTL
jgi:hypothetical protein